MSGKSVYISGPMRGYDNYNYPAFHAAAKRWREAGWYVVNPAENFDGDQTRSLHEYMRIDIAHVCQCGAIAMLPGWRESQGAGLEYAVAVAIGSDLYDAVSMLPLPQEDVLAEAQRLVFGARNKSYSHPSLDYGKTAAMWSGLLLHKLKEPITPKEAVLMMVLLKCSREQYAHKRDNLVDMAGYALCAHRIETGE